MASSEVQNSKQPVAVVTVAPALTLADIEVALKINRSYEAAETIELGGSANSTMLATGFALSLSVVALKSPIRKTFPIEDGELQPSDRVFIAKVDDVPAGWAQVEFHAWHRRAVLQHLYVSPAYRRCGVGVALLNAVTKRAEQGDERKAVPRCLWLEAQNLNVGAIRFYLRQGFKLCGFDSSLYDPEDPCIHPGEFALFFSRPLFAVRPLDPQLQRFGCVVRVLQFRLR